jgi:hypothetical protein
MPSPDYDVGPRFGLRALKGDSNVSDIDAGFFALRDDVENKTLGYSSGLHSARPTVGTAGRLYRETDTGLYFIDTGAAWLQVPVAAIDGAMRGATNIATSESRTNTAYGTLTTPDQVTVVLPTNGQIVVGYQAAWQESVAGASRAAIFIGANQLRAGGSAATPPLQAAGNNGTPAVNHNCSLTTCAAGLVTGTALDQTDATTGQIVGQVSNGANIWMDLGGAILPLGTGAVEAGPCWVFAAAGTYTVSVQFKASSGSVTASNRKLWVEAKSFG